MTVNWLEPKDADAAVAAVIEPVEVVLDIGCGVRPQSFFRPRTHICCEPHREYVDVLKQNFADDPTVVVLQGTGEEAARLFPDRSVDSIFLLDVVEHIEKEAGLRLLRECERIARRQIVVLTPLGFLRQEVDGLDAWGMHGGKWQEHQSGWMPDDFGEEWDVYAVPGYHERSSDGQRTDEAGGAMWAIRNLQAAPVERRLDRKLAVVSALLPPSPSAQPMMLYRLLSALDPDDYVAISVENYDPYRISGALHAARAPLMPTKLPVPYFFLPPEPELPVPGRVELALGGAVGATRKLFKVAQRAKRIAAIVEKERCEAILGCSGNLYDLPASYLASRWTRKPFYAYMFDDYQLQWPHGAYHLFARLVERMLVRGASGVIAPTEYLADDYSQRYGIRPAVVRNAADLASDLPEEGANAWPSAQEEIAIVHTGAVDPAQFDAFRNLVRAVDQVERSDLRLHIYTAQPPEVLAEQGIAGPVVVHAHLPESESRAIQRRADILFLPLSFEAIPEVIRTSAPGKMAEYLGSGRPVLAHAPKGSFVADYFTRRECGLVADEPSVDQVSDAIRQIVEDDELRSRLVANALAAAHEDFDLAVQRERFLDLLGASRPDAVAQSNVRELERVR